MAGTGGSYTLTNASNSITGSVAGNTGSINLSTNNTSYTVGTVNGINGITTTGNTTLAAGTSPYFVMSGTGTSQISAYLSFTPGTYQVIVTASGFTCPAPPISLGARPAAADATRLIAVRDVEILVAP